MSDTQRDREERQHVIEVLKSWDGYFIGYTSDEVQEVLRYAIASIETDLRYDLLYEETSEQADKPTTKNDLGVASGLDKNSKKLEKGIPKNDLGVDLISRADVLQLMQDNWHIYNGDLAMQESIDDIRALSPVIPQEPRCKDCKWWKDSDGAYRRGVKAESQCPINRKEVYEGNGYCYMYEPQESEDKK